MDFQFGLEIASSIGYAFGKIRFHPMSPSRLTQQLSFLVEIERLKVVLRQSSLIGGERRENSAEHSWHVMLLAMVFEEYAAEPIDLLRVLKMLAIHDLVEIDAGDTFHYHKTGDTTAEKAAAERIFSLLPAPQGEELKELWNEFEERRSADAKYAAAVDRLWPIVQNLHNKGDTWLRFQVTLEDVIRKTGHIAEGAPAVWDHFEQLLRDAADKGLMHPKGSS